MTNYILTDTTAARLIKGEGDHLAQLTYDERTGKFDIGDIVEVTDDNIAEHPDIICQHTQSKLLQSFVRFFLNKYDWEIRAGMVFIYSTVAGEFRSYVKTNWVADFHRDFHGIYQCKRYEARWNLPTQMI